MVASITKVVVKNGRRLSLCLVQVGSTHRSDRLTRRKLL